MRTLLVASVVLVALAALGVASTTAATRVARGGGEFASEAPFAFFAQKRDGTTTGWAWFFMADAASPYPLEGRVKCLLVEGKKAVMAGTLTVPAAMPGSSTTWRSFVLVVEDLGSGGNAPTDAAGLSFLDGATAPPCSSVKSNGATEMAAGDVIVS